MEFGQKKLVKSNKSISRFFVEQIPSFFHFKNGQKSIFELGKSLKLPKMQFHEKKYLNFFDCKICEKILAIRDRA